MKHSHVPCPVCSRLLVPIDNKIPRHKRPDNSNTWSAKAAPLTGPEADWCSGGEKLVYA